MEKIRNLSLRKSIVLYMAAALAVCFVVGNLIVWGAGQVQQNIWMKYIDKEKFYQTVGAEETFEFIVQVPRPGDGEMAAGDYFLSELCDFLESWAILIVSILGCSIAVFLLYQHKIKRPLELLEQGSRHISQNDLEFPVEYENKDEMGQLCREFDNMRVQLLHNNKKMWDMIEQEKALKAAIAHDIRSPLAVLQGYQETLLEFVPEGMEPEELTEILNAQMKQIERLGTFIDTMSKLSALEEREPEYKKLSINELKVRLEQTAAMMCERQGIVCQISDRSDHSFVTADAAIIQEVYENLLSNAIRYAKEKIAVAISFSGDKLEIMIQDDGRGFDQSEEQLTEAYYHANPQDDRNHSGLGLYISRLYCEKHGGRLLLGSSNFRGACAKAQFKVK